MLAIALATLPMAHAAGAAPDPKAQLGRLLFFDTALSEPAGQSCASCHAPATAFTDPDATKPTSKGVHPERFGNRNTPSAMYMAFSPKFHFDRKEKQYVGGQFWDGRAATLEDQAKGPLLNPVEMANPNKRAVVDKVRKAPYAGQFDAVFGKGALVSVDRAYDHIAAAIAAYERTAEFQPFSSRYDAWLAGKGQLTEQELRGLRLYEDEKKGNCAACHPSQRGPNGEPPLFTDFTYDNLGVPPNPENPFYLLERRLNPDGFAFVDRGLGAVVKDPAQNGKFRVPTLRNVAVTAPYMHNGVFKTLFQVLAFYNTRDVAQWPAPEVGQNVNREELGNLRLTNQELEDVVAFLHTLTDGWKEPAFPPQKGGTR
jgi:cytochrome c peroxidase